MNLNVHIVNAQNVFGYSNEFKRFENSSHLRNSLSAVSTVSNRHDFWDYSMNSIHHFDSFRAYGNIHIGNAFLWFLLITFENRPFIAVSSSTRRSRKVPLIGVRLLIVRFYPGNLLSDWLLSAKQCHSRLKSGRLFKETTNWARTERAEDLIHSFGGWSLRIIWILSCG